MANQTHQVTTLPDGAKIHHGPYPELTWHAVIVGWVLGAVIAVSIGYAALILGFSIEGSELAAILGWGILRGIMGRTSIVENNINQTIASAVNGASSGMMFSIPALFILNRQFSDKYAGIIEFNKILMVLACATGAVVGLAFVIPLRKQMIDFDRLAYPGGIAVATILKSPGAGIQKAMLLIGGALVSGLFYFVMIVFKSDHPEGHLGETLGAPSFLNLTFFLSLMTLGVGFLSGKGGYWFGAGGFICYWLLAPLMSTAASDGVQERFNPPVSQAIFVRDDVGALRLMASDVEGSDPQIAAVIRSWADTAQRIPDRFAADGEPANLLSVTQNPLIDTIATVHQDLTKRASVQKATASTAEGDVEADKVPYAAHATKLGKLSNFQAMLDARQLLTEPDEPVFQELAKSTRGREVIRRLQEASNLSDDTQATIQSASRAQGMYNAIPNDLRLTLFRPSGIGMLIGAAIGGIIAAFPLMLSAFKSMRDAARESNVSDADEMPLRNLILGVAGGAIILVILTYYSVEKMGFGTALTMAVLGTIWVWIAGVIVSECVGRTNWSPLSGMTLIAVTILIVIASRSGLDDTSVIIASMFLGGAMCVGISQASDMMLDLKSGYLIGAQPKMQQYGQLIGTWLGPIVVIGVILVLDKNQGLGTESLPAPQGKALASVIQGVLGDDVPTYRYLAGGGLGLLLALSGLGGIGVQVGLGFYMPFNVVLTYTIGCTLRVIFNKYADRKFVEGSCVPIAAGLIVGEALVGVGNAIYQILLK